MNEPLTKHRATVDLDQFERDLQSGTPYRGGAPYHAGEPYHHDDPLAELARLVGEQHDPYGDVFAREAAAPAQMSTHAPDNAGRREPGFGADAAMSPRLSGSFAAIEAGLRGTMDPTYAPGAPMHAEPTFDPAYGHAADAAAYDQNAHDQAAYDQAYDQNPWADPQRAAPKSRRSLHLAAATIAIGVIGIGTAFALKGQIGTSPREVKTILADSSPTKVQPPADQAAANDAGQDAVLGKGQPAPTGLASHEEQPVDVAQAVQDNAGRRADANSVPVPLSPGQIQTAMADPRSSPAGTSADPIGAASQNFAMSDMPAPKRVRVVSVRPDGSILSDDTPPPAAIPAARQPAATKTGDKPAAVAKPSTPKSMAKTTSRVTTPKDIAQLAGDDAASAPVAPAVKPVAKKLKPQPQPQPQRVASADTGEQEATAAAAPEPAIEGAGGGFAVQLAAPGSEADARAASSRLAKKFAGSLGGRHLGFHKADSNGRSVYRVRVSSLSKPDAVSLCEKLKADGGSCFVAKN